MGEAEIMEMRRAAVAPEILAKCIVMDGYLNRTDCFDGNEMQ